MVDTCNYTCSNLKMLTKLTLMQTMDSGWSYPCRFISFNKCTILVGDWLCICGARGHVGNLYLFSILLWNQNSKNKLGWWGVPLRKYLLKRNLTHLSIQVHCESSFILRNNMSLGCGGRCWVENHSLYQLPPLSNLAHINKSGHAVTRTLLIQLKRTSVQTSLTIHTWLPEASGRRARARQFLYPQKPCRFLPTLWRPLNTNFSKQERTLMLSTSQGLWGQTAWIALTSLPFQTVETTQ